MTTFEIAARLSNLIFNLLRLLLGSRLINSLLYSILNNPLPSCDLGMYSLSLLPGDFTIIIVFLYEFKITHMHRQKTNDDDEIEVFTRKIRTLNDISKNLSETIKRQNSEIKGISPNFNKSLLMVQSIVGRLTNVETRRFQSLLLYALISGGMLLFIFVFFIVF